MCGRATQKHDRRPNLLPGVRARLRPRRDRHRGRADRSPARPRASGVARLGVQQRDCDPRRAPRSRPALASASPRRRRLRAGVVGRRDGGHRRGVARDQDAPRRLVDRRLHRQPDGLQRPRLGRHDAVPPGARHASDLQRRHAGLQQQVRGERVRVRVEHAAPRPRFRPHRLLPDPRLEPRRLAHELHLHRGADRGAARDRSARRQGPLREPAPHRVREVGRRRVDPDPARYRRLLPGGVTARARAHRRLRRAGAGGARQERRGFPGVHRALLARARERSDRHRGRRRPHGRTRVEERAGRVGHDVDRRQHGPAGHARVLARPHALVRDRQPRPPRRQHRVGRLLPDRGEGRPHRPRADLLRLAFRPHASRPRLAAREPARRRDSHTRSRPGARALRDRRQPVAVDGGRAASP